MSKSWAMLWVPVGVVALFFFAWGNWRIPLTNWDEGIFSHVSLEFSQTTNWATPTYFQEPHLGKPPLYYWLSAATIMVFGNGELSLRLWSILAGVGTTVLLSVWAAQYFGRRWWGVLAAFLFLTGRFVTVHAFRTGDTDGLLLLFIVGSLYGYWRAQKNPRWMMVWGAAAGLAIMTKSAIGTLPLLISGIDYVLSRGWRVIPSRWVGGGLLIALGIAAPWHIVMTIQYGDTFWHTYIGEQVVHRASTAFFEATPWYWYGKSIVSAWYPWGAFLPLAVMVGVLAWWRRRDPLIRLSLIWTIFVLALFSISASRRAWYILPLYPGALFLLVLMIKEIWAKRTRWQTGLFFASLFGVLYFLPAAFNRLSVTRYLTAYGWLAPEYHTTMWRLLIALVALLVVAGVAWLIRRRGGATTIMMNVWALYLSVLAIAWSATAIHVPFHPYQLQTLAPKISAAHITHLTVTGITPANEPAGMYYISRLPGMTLTISDDPAISGDVLTRDVPKNSAIMASGTVVLREGIYVVLRRGE